MSHRARLTSQPFSQHDWERELTVLFDMLFPLGDRDELSRTVWLWALIGVFLGHAERCMVASRLAEPLGRIGEPRGVGVIIVGSKEGLCSLDIQSMLR